MSKKILVLNHSYPLDMLSVDTNLVDNELLSQCRSIVEHRLVFTHYTCLPRNDRIAESFDTLFDTSIPDFKKYTNISFQEATDSRAIELLSEVAKSDLPILIYWSGGIDSTLIVTAVMKHFPTEVKKRITIVMNNASYIENPVFFKKIIEPNFKYTSNPNHNYTNSIILHGDPADALWLQGNVISESKNADFVGDNIHKDPTNVMSLFRNNRLIGKEAESTLDFVINNAKISNIELTSTADIMWWINFSMQLETMCHKRLGEISLGQISSDAIKAYQQNFKPWYLSDLYQVWSIQAQFNGEKFDNSIRSYKMPAKKYIYDVDGNQYYRDYKTKLKSQYSYGNDSKYPYVIYSDGTVSTHHWEIHPRI